MNLPVGEELGAHIVQVVALLKVSVVGPEGCIVGKGELLFQGVELIVGILLELVSEPGGQIPLLVGPGNGLWNFELAYGAVLGRSL